MIDAGALLGFISLVGVIALTAAMFLRPFQRKDAGDGGEIVKYYKKENDDLQKKAVILEAEKEAMKAEKEAFLTEMSGMKKRIADLEKENADLRSRVDFLFEQLTEKKSPQKPPSSTLRRAVLFVSTSPVPGAILNTGAEAQIVEDCLRRTGWEFKAVQAARIHDITQAILEFKPTILHFAGHGADGEIYLDDDAHKPRIVPLEVLARLMRGVHVTGIVLNACYSAKNINVLLAVSDWVVGMRKAVGDKFAIGYSDGFYLALANGQTVQVAHDIGVGNAGAQSPSEMDTPILEMRR